MIEEKQPVECLGQPIVFALKNFYCSFSLYSALSGTIYVLSLPYIYL